MFICRNGDTLPHSWEVAVLPDVAEVNPRTDFSGYEDGRIISFIPMPLVEEKTGKLDSSRTEELRKVKKGYTRFIEGDVLFAKITPCMENGKVALAEKLQGGIGAGSTEYHVLRAYSGVLNRYLLYYLLQAAFRQDAQHHMTGTAGQKRVPSKYIENSQIPLPPTDEQHRIVSKIEELFSDLDQGEAALRKVQTLLTRYRQAVLKAAVTGELTRDWRAANRHRLESGEALLQRILQARRENWNGRGKYKEPAAPNTEGLPELPEGWVWVTLDFVVRSLITGPFGSSLHKEDYVDNAIPVVNPTNIKDGFIYPDMEVTVDGDVYQRLSRYALEVGDVVMGRRGEMGRCAAVSQKEKGWLCGTGSLIIRPTNLILPEYFAVVISSDMGRQHLERNCVGTTMKNLNQNALLSMPVPLPSIEEQAEILVKREEVRVQTETISTWCNTELARSATLRQAILKAAFSGQLVPQDPADEPAGGLLERIRAERAARGNGKQPSGKPKRGGRGGAEQMELL